MGGASLNWHRNDARELAVEFWIYVVAAAAAALEASAASFAATAMRAKRMWMRSTRRRRCVCKLEFVWAVPCGSSLATPTLTLFPAAKRGGRHEINEIFLNILRILTYLLCWRNKR